MSKSLNLKSIQESMLELGLSQQGIAEALEVSKASVSDWLRSKKFPRPKHLLKLGKLLKLGYQDLVINIAATSSQVAFRKSGNYKITDEHVRQFHYIARLLEKLVPHLPYDLLSSPPFLKDPKIDYEYIQKAAYEVRKRIVGDDGKIAFSSLIDFFTDLKAILVPVMWGSKHEKNATHVYLPDSSTTWVFLNLDTCIFDFKFWMSHELGHAKAPYLIDDDGETFADSFAGALLYPHDLAESLYEKLIAIQGIWERIEVVKEEAKKFEISPLIIYYQLQYYCKEFNKDSLDLEEERAIFRANTVLMKEYKLVSEALFNSTEPTNEQYIRISKEAFRSDFFTYLKQYIIQDGSISPKFISNILNISIADAYEIMTELVGNESTKTK